MAFSAPSLDMARQYSRHWAKSERRAEALESDIRRLKAQEAGYVPLSSLLPQFAKTWLQDILCPPAVREAILKTQLEHSNVVHEQVCCKGPLNARERKLSMTDEPLGKSQLVSLQTQSGFFSILPPEIRNSIYMAVLTGLEIEIQASPTGHYGRPSFNDLACFEGARVENAVGQIWYSPHYGCDLILQVTSGLRPWILPLLETCRRV